MKLSLGHKLCGLVVETGRRKLIHISGRGVWHANSAHSQKITMPFLPFFSEYNTPWHINMHPIFGVRLAGKGLLPMYTTQ